MLREETACHRVLLGGDRGTSFQWLRLHWRFPCGWYSASRPDPVPVGSPALRLPSASLALAVSLDRNATRTLPSQRRDRRLHEGCRRGSEGDAEGGECVEKGACCSCLGRRGLSLDLMGSQEYHRGRVKGLYLLGWLPTFCRMNTPCSSFCEQRHHRGHASSTFRSSKRIVL